jgi:hypothetical protein
VVNLIYPEQSMIVATFVLPDEDGNYVFSEESEVLGVNLFAASDFETVLADAVVYEWEGFEALDTYLGQAEEE